MEAIEFKSKIKNGLTRPEEETNTPHTPTKTV